MRIAIALFVIACSAPRPAETIANERMPTPQEQLLPVAVHGTVVDYGNRVVAGATVSVSSEDASIRLETDKNGKFELRAPKRARLSAHKHDMLGSATLGDAADQTIVIKMAQMPM